ncbi:MAG: hypothetical protein AABX84_00165 [Nanoarchaeota archaeon]
MRKILSKHDAEKKAKRNRIILGLILIFIMFFSVAEYSFLNFNQNNQENPVIDKTTYKDFEFSEQNGYWILNKDGNSFIFSYNPNEIPRINSIVNPIENYQGKILYLISNSSIAESEIRVNIGQFVNGIINVEKENCEQNTIIIKESSENKILQKDNCVYIEGKKDDLVKVTDEFFFKLLKISN